MQLQNAGEKKSMILFEVGWFTSPRQTPEAQSFGALGRFVHFVVHNFLLKLKNVKKKKKNRKNVRISKLKINTQITKNHK